MIFILNLTKKTAPGPLLAGLSGAGGVSGLPVLARLAAPDQRLYCYLLRL